MMYTVIIATDFKWSGHLKFIPREGEEITIKKADSSSARLAINRVRLVIDKVELVIDISGDQFVEINCTEMK